MFEYAVNDLMQILVGLQTTSTLLKSAKEPLSPPEWGTLKKVGTALSGLHKLGQKIALESVLLDMIAQLKEDAWQKHPQVPAIVFKSRLDAIIEGIIGALKSRRFMFVPSDQASYWENPRLFGDDFRAEFPAAAVAEGIEAGNCFAAGRWTACVFHCMRVAEYGLRKIAQTLKVKTIHKGKVFPVEYADWEKVIAAIQAKIADIRKVPRGPKRQELLRAYSSAADHCEYMKDIWRNETAHTRRLYNKVNCLSAISDVQGFIQSLPKSRPK
jgi:hypothetical protein